MVEGAVETVPVGVEFTGVETAAGGATDSAPEDFGDVVAVVECVFVA